MIIDTSAAVSMMRGEPDAAYLAQLATSAERLRMSASSVLELHMVTCKEDPDAVEDFLAEMNIEVLPIDLEQLRWARVGFSLYGRGSGSPAKLNYGDCFSYGAAKALREPLLFKGDDFIHTDVQIPTP